MRAQKKYQSGLGKNFGPKTSELGCRLSHPSIHTASMEITSSGQHSKRAKTQYGKGNDSSSSSSSLPSVAFSNEDKDLSPLSVLVDGIRNTEKYYNAHNMCVKVLVTMCHGIRDTEGSPLLDIDAIPWKNISRMKTCPNTEHYVAEVDWRWKHFQRLWQVSAKDDSCAPRPKGWKLTKLHQWLSDHPIVAKADKDFLGKVVSIPKAPFDNAAAKIAEDDAKLGAGKWVGKYPFLQVLHVVIDNEDSK